MTLPKMAQPLIDAARSAGKQVRIVHLPVGHNEMSEAPDAMLSALMDFLKKP
jgi:pimeloyl-ACP methyl ester carboxylesterase